MRSCQKFPPFPAEPIPESSKAGPIRNGGNSSAITYVRRREEKKKLLYSYNCSRRRVGCEHVRGTSMQTPRPMEKEGGEMLQAPGL